MCASPAYLAVNGKPRHLDDLASHAPLQLETTGREQAALFSPQTREGSARSMQMLQLPGKFICNDFRGLLVTCQDSIDVAQLPQPLAALRQGLLKPLLPDHAPDD